MGAGNVVTMTYTKNTETLIVEVWDDNKPNRPVSTKTYTATNNPQPMQEPNATTLPSEQPYYPQPYPNGTWKVKSVSHPHTKDFGQTKINTNAGQNVKTYKYENEQWEQSGTTWDTGYQIHGGGYSSDPLGENNVNDNTYGCIRMKNADVNELGETLEKHLKNNVPITLTVQDKEPPKKPTVPRRTNMQTKEKKNK